MSWLGRKFASFLWWTYPRGSLEYDIMVGVILAFIFLTPRHFFRDQPRASPVPVPAFSGGIAFPSGPDALALLLPLAPQAAPPPPATLAGVLQALNAAAPGIHSVSANAEVADYTALVQDTTRSSGMLYFKRAKADAMYSLDLTSPPALAKHLVYRDRTGYIYTPSSKQVIRYALGDKQDLVNQFLLLGMASTGDDLTRSFHVAYDGPAALDGLAAVKLTLTPLQADVQGKLSSIDLWYDTHTWIAAQQQIFQQGGDYHLLHLTNIKRDPRLDDSLFSTDFRGATVITPHP